MDKSKLLKKLFSEKTRDYTYFSLFFIIFSVFVIFAIKPSLTTAFSLKKEAEDLAKVNSYYDKVVMGVVNIQSLLENSRDQIFVMEQAISTRPRVNKVAGDLQSAADENNLKISKLSIEEINLTKDTQGVLKTVRVSMEARSSFEDLMGFIGSFYQQRRIKALNKLTVSRDNSEVSTGSGQLKVVFDLEGYYL